MFFLLSTKIRNDQIYITLFIIINVVNITEMFRFLYIWLLSKERSEHAWSFIVKVSVCLMFFVLYFYVNVTITYEGRQIFTYVQDLWPSSSGGSLTCHTCCDTAGSSIYNGHLRGPVTLTLVAERLAVEL